MKILIVDDELSARNLLRVMLTDIFKNKNKNLILFEANCLTDAIDLIKEEEPKIVLLDIEMPGHSGLEILNFFKDEPVNFNLIFITAYSDYALEAFRLNAIDYLLKPTDIKELEKAISKAEIESFAILQSKMEDLRKTFLELNASKIVLEVPTGLIFIAPTDIIAFVADSSYTTVYLNNGTKTLVAKGLKYFMDQLSNYNYFYRPHRSYFINLKFLKEFSRKDGTTITLENGMTIPLSRDKKDKFLYMINTVFR